MHTLIEGSIDDANIGLNEFRPDQLPIGKIVLLGPSYGRFDGLFDASLQMPSCKSFPCNFGWNVDKPSAEALMSVMASVGDLRLHTFRQSERQVCAMDRRPIRCSSLRLSPLCILSKWL